jgi:hypothetical protein
MLICGLTQTRDNFISCLQTISLYVQERKKCEFVDGLLEFTRSWVRFYQKGNSVALEYADYLADLANRQTWIPEFHSFAARWLSNLQPQSTELTRGPPELVEHFRL